MAYVGNQPARGQFRKLTDISGSFNGVTTTFTTSVPPGTTSYYVTAGTASQLLVSLGGVIQQPEVDYTVSTNSITFTTAPAAGLSFFGVLMGDALNSGTPGDGTVTTTKLAGNLNVGLAGGSAASPSLYFTGDTNNGIYSPGADTLAISTNAVQRVTVNSSGNVGIGTASVDQRLVVSGGFAATGSGSFVAGNAAGVYLSYESGGEARVFARSVGTASDLSFWTSTAGGSAERARIDSSGRLLVGTSSATAVTDGNVSAQVEVEGTTTATSAISIIRNSNDTNSGGLIIAKSRGTTAGSNTLVSSGDSLGFIQFQGADGTQKRIGASIDAVADAATGLNDLPTRLVFSTTADGASSPTERMRISQAGFLSVGNVTSYTDRHVIQHPTQTQGNINLAVTNTGIFYVSAGGGANAAATSVVLSKNDTTNRSINAAGTINASGADYAEYMVKDGDFTISKGAICGVTIDGLLTLDYADAVSFVVKSTNPSYVGGDTWGSEGAVGPKPDADDTDALTKWEADLEAARQKVDRIAFAGQVPVNVMGATPGQYIVPVEADDGGIEGIAKNKSDMTAAEYMDAVGKVIAIEDDGRARIIVKVA